MEFSLETKAVSLSVGEFAGFTIGPHETGGGPQGLWRAQLGQHWHNELRTRALAEFPSARFEVVIDGRLSHRGWTFALNGRIDQLLPPDSSPDCRAGSLTPPQRTTTAGSGDPALQSEAGQATRGMLLREIKTVLRPLPMEEAALRAEYPSYFLQLAAYAVLRRTLGAKGSRAELIFVEAGSGLSQTIALTPFDEALVYHQLDAIVEFLNLRRRATERRRSLVFQPAFKELRPGQETIQADLTSCLLPPAPVLLFEAPTGYGKTGCVLEFALGQLRSGRFARLIWLTGKSTGQIQVMQTLEGMTSGHETSRPSTSPTGHAIASVAAWQVRNKAEHCVNHTFHCVRDGCEYLLGCTERWPQSGLAKFYLDGTQPHDLDTLRAAGRHARICPYEITRTALAFNDVWVGDFNYVFAPDNRSLFFEQPGFDPTETLLVIDEAHNLPSRVAGAHSHRASESDARLLLAELDHLRAPAPLVLAVEEWARLLASLQPADSLEPGMEAEIHELVTKLANLVDSQPLDYAALGPRHSESLWQFAALAGFLSDTKLTRLLWVSREGELEFTCVDAAPAIGETLRGFGGAILMSATMQPYESMAAACGLKGICGSELAPTNYSTLHAPTPWRTGAYDVAVDVRVDTTFKQRASFYGTTAATIETVHAAAPAGGGVPSPRAIAVFFPSYAYAESVLRTLENRGSVLRVSLQPKLPDLAAQTAWVEESLLLADALFLVLGSSFAEGIDLLGGRVTHAMVVGPALPEVNAVQKARMDALNGLGRDAAFRRVYQIPGLQKVNQALGRLVRAPGQHAKVLLHCRRFAEPSYASLLAADYQMFTEVTSESDLRDWLGAGN